MSWILLMPLAGPAPAQDRTIDWDTEISSFMQELVSPPNAVTSAYIQGLDNRIARAEGSRKLELLFLRSVYVNPVFLGPEAEEFCRNVERAAAQANTTESYLLAAFFGAFVDALQKNPDDGLARLDELIAEADEQDRPGIVAVGLAYKSQVHAMNMRNGQALVAARKALDYLDTAGSADWRQLLVYETIVFVSAISRDANLALTSARGVLRLSQQLGVPHDQFRNGVFLFLAFSHMQSPDFMREFIRTVLTSAPGSFYENEAPHKLLMSELARLEMALGNYDAAYQLASRASAEMHGSPRHDWWAEVNLARAAAYTGRMEEAETYMARVEAKYESMQSVGVLSQDLDWAMWEARATLLKAGGDHEAAYAAFQNFYLDQAQRWRSIYQDDMNAIRGTLLADLERQRIENQLVTARLEMRDQELLAFCLLAGILLAGVIMLVVLMRRLRHSEAQAHAASHAKSRLLANVSHELRTPLNAILGFSEIMKNRIFGPLNNERYESYVKSIYKSGSHLLSVIEELLDISRIEAGKLELKESLFSLDDLIQQTVGLLQPQVRKAGIDCYCKIPDKDLQIHADAKLIRQSVINLVNNAMKFTPAGGRVDVLAEEAADGSLEITVSDTGIGMTDKEIAVALKPFGQVQSVMSRDHEGSGLGLPIVEGFVKAHGGHMTITSRKGQGTVVSITLPASRIRHTRAQKTPEERPEFAPAGHARAAS